MIGMLRVQNEQRWIQRVIKSILPICEHVYVLDDHSEDGTPEICSSFEQVTAWESPFEGLNESRDKDWLLEQTNLESGTWVLWIDGDEELHHADVSLVSDAAMSGKAEAFSLRIVYLWNNARTVRTDGCYQNFTRPSLFRYQAGMQFRSTAYGGNFHCCNIPCGIGNVLPCAARLMHYGYMEQSDRMRKYLWYNAKDPENVVEDRYRHITQGDPGGAYADKRLIHAGPLRLERL